MNTEEITNEIQELKECIDKLLNQLVDTDPVHTFDVTLRIRTKESAWPDGKQLHSGVIHHHFNDLLDQLIEAVSFTDPGDEIKVLNVTEVDNEYP